MKKDDIDNLVGRVQAARTQTWTVGPTPAALDLAARCPPDRPSATVCADGTPVATFWSYLHHGPRNAEYVAWMGRHAAALLEGTLATDTATVGLALLAEVAYRNWWAGPTPSYLRGGDPHAITLRTPQHTEEIATLWGPQADEAAVLVCWFVNAGPDLLAKAWGEEGYQHVMTTLLPVLERAGRVTLDPEAVEAAVTLAGDHAEHRAPIAYALVIVALAAEEATPRDSGCPCVITADALQATLARWP